VDSLSFRLQDNLFFCRNVYKVRLDLFCAAGCAKDNMVRKGEKGMADECYSFLGSFGKLLQTNKDKILRDEEINNAEIAYTEFENVMTENLLQSRYVVVTAINIIIIEFSNDTITVTRIKRKNGYFIVDKEYKYQETVTRFPLGYIATVLTISLSNGEAVKFYRPDDTLIEHQKNFEKFVNVIE